MSGSFLNVTLKNKILSIDTVLEYLEQHNYNDKRNQKKIKDDLIGRSFKVGYAKRNYTINDIDFQKDPENTTINRDGHSMNLLNYYKVAHNIEIQKKKQPLIVVRNNDTNIYFIPELSYLGGLDDSAVKNGQFMKELANYTKLKPELKDNENKPISQPEFEMILCPLTETASAPAVSVPASCPSNSRPDHPAVRSGWRLRGRSR